eukprot:CAMPEP_0113504522 /NCGR_PEP_ID=MMETSP0014_2-20120614/34760_1 /TAXON_ID=2857 /ORGANISM="Nitzschia sp." /LENGTH=308 /DNA_ID=CAMNT_0000399637 /DNA_START=363 /DNA_END=1286 /DNA_ORIENTATION=- /assembly_acc=CAM_ASM_000159
MDDSGIVPLIGMEEDEEEDDDDVIAIILAATSIQAPAVPTTVIVNGQVVRSPYPQRNNGVAVPRGKYDHVGALTCINRDYLGPSPLMGSQFKLQFRMSRTMFEFILQEVMNSGSVFYRPRDIDEAASIEARLLLPIKTLAYGVPSHCFMDYFQMSKSQCRRACSEFDKVMLDLFAERFLHFPTSDDLRNIVDLHKAVHGVNGMLGSLDCTKTYWRHCPNAWQGAFTSGKEGKPSIVLEAVTDHHTYVWHFSYGCVGSMNDLNVLAASPLFAKFLDGTLARIETESGAVPYTIGTQSFDSAFLLVDGIY